MTLKGGKDPRPRLLRRESVASGWAPKGTEPVATQVGRSGGQGSAGQGLGRQSGREGLVWTLVSLESMQVRVHGPQQLGAGEMSTNLYKRASELTRWA